MTARLACNYAIVRFLPYPETEEFVNIGVVMACPQTGFFDYRLETRRRERVTHFFPEIDPVLLTAGRKAFHAELERVTVDMRPGNTAQLTLETEARELNDRFRYLTRPTESLFRFGECSTLITTNPEAELERLFKDHVHRRFAVPGSGYEHVMANRLQQTLRTHDIRTFREARVGNDSYHVTMPMVHKMDGLADRVIKPFDLRKETPKAIFDHGDPWCGRLMRLRNEGVLPPHILFAIRYPLEETLRQAAVDVQEGLREFGVVPVDAADEAQVIAFASDAA